MKLSACLVMAVLLVITHNGVCQTGQTITSHNYEIFTPVTGDPSAKIEKVSGTGSRAVFLLMNSRGVHSILLYAAAPVFEWFSIPPPDSKADVIDISATYDGGVFALYRDASGQTGISYFFGTKWSRLSTGKLNGEIISINAFSNVYLFATGNFSQDGHAYHLAVYDYDKKWKPALAADDAMFENTTIKKLSFGGNTDIQYLLLQNNSTGKYSIVVYDGSKFKHTWETLGPVPGPVTDMAVTGNNTVYICGSEEGSGKPYLTRWLFGAWKQIPMDAAGFTRPEILQPGTTSYENNVMYVTGPSKNGPFAEIDHLSDTRWTKSDIAPANPKTITENQTYLLTEENGNSVFYRSKDAAQKSPLVASLVKGPPTKTFAELETEARKKKAQQNYDIAIAENNKVYTSLEEVMDSCKAASIRYEAHVIYIDPEKTAMEAWQQTIDESNKYSNDFISHYQGKLRQVKIKEDETALAAAFEKWLNAKLAEEKDIHDGFTSMKNIALTMQRENKTDGIPAAVEPYKKGLKNDVEKHKALIAQARIELNTQWALYQQKNNLKKGDAF